MDDYDRRDFLRASVPGFLGVLMALPGLGAMAVRANGHEGRLAKEGAMNWEAFLEGVAKEAAKQHLDRWNEEAYLIRLSNLARQLHREDPVLQLGFAQIRKRLEQGNVDFESLEKRVDFAICLVQFEKGQQIAAHDHPGMTGMILCANGSVETKNYDLIEELKIQRADGVEETRCVLRQTAQQILKPSAITTLTSKARNIHTLKARAVTQLIDIFTPPYNDEREEQSRWFAIDDRPRAGTKNEFEALVK